jgi:hypothetical protein
MLTKKRNTLIKNKLNIIVGSKLVETAEKTAVESFNAFYSKTVMTKQ